MIEGWHGGPAHFDAFSYDFIGTGEGSALGRGFYFSEYRKGGEYFGEYANFSKGSGFLYRTLLHLEPNEILDLDISLKQQPLCVKEKVSFLFRLSSKEEILHADYNSLRYNDGDKKAAQVLLKAGIKAIKTDEGTKPGHGLTFLVLDNAVTSIEDVYRFDRNSRHWLDRVE